MIRKTSTLIVCLSALCAVAAAQSPESQLMGKWIYKELQAPAGTPQTQLDMARKMYANSTVQFGSEHDFALTAGGHPAIQGKWKISGRQISITPTSYNGKTIIELKAQFQELIAKNPQLAQDPRVNMQMSHISDPLKASISGDGRTIVLLATAGNTGSLTFVKASS